MTLSNVTDQLWSLSVDSPEGRFNGIPHATKEWLGRFLHHWFVEIGDRRWIMEVNLPDGRWLVRISRVGDGYDYLIPDTREQELFLRDELLGVKAHGEQRSAVS